MKAWMFQNDEGYAYVVFAETRGKARTYIQNMDYAPLYTFIEIDVRRFPEADKFYDGEIFEMDWNNPVHRLFLIQHGWHCIDYHSIDDCRECVGCDICEYSRAEEEEY